MLVKPGVSLALGEPAGPHGLQRTRGTEEDTDFLSAELWLPQTSATAHPTVLSPLTLGLSSEQFPFPVLRLRKPPGRHGRFPQGRQFCASHHHHPHTAVSCTDPTCGGSGLKASPSFPAPEHLRLCDVIHPLTPAFIRNIA